MRASETGMANSQDIGFLVIPDQGTRRVMSRAISGVINIDDICGYDKDPFLSVFAEDCAKTGDWEIFYRYQAGRTAVRLTPHKWLIMVPTEKLGNVFGWKYLGCLYSTRHTLKESPLYDTPKVDVQEKVATQLLNPGAVFYSHTEELSEHIIEIALVWLK